MNNLGKRILFSIPAAAFFIWVTWLGGWVFKAMIIGIAFFIIREMIRMLEGAGNPVDILFPYTIGLWVMLSYDIPYSVDIGIIIFILFISIQVFNNSPYKISELSSTIFAGFYAPVGLLSLMLLNDFGNNAQGFMITIMLALMVWGSDVFAYFGGKLFGKHSLAKAISPNKTWEGFFAGYIGALAGSALIFYLVPIYLPITYLQIIPMAMLVATFGPLGDLLESKLKRAANLKDSSSILPGHGGFFDRFDSFLLAAPVSYVYIHILVKLELIVF